MPNCSLCGVAMIASEKPGRKDGTVAPYHAQCSEIDALFFHPATAMEPFFKNEIGKARAKLIAKRAGTLTDYP